MAKRKQCVFPKRMVTKRWVKALLAMHMPDENVIDLIFWCREVGSNDMTDFIVKAMEESKGTDWFDRVTGRKPTRHESNWHAEEQ
jgi:hypothetical protein